MCDSDHQEERCELAIHDLLKTIFSESFKRLFDSKRFFVSIETKKRGSNDGLVKI
jgi:hypothetical protein